MVWKIPSVKVVLTLSLLFGMATITIRDAELIRSYASADHNVEEVGSKFAYIGYHDGDVVIELFDNGSWLNIQFNDQDGSAYPANVRLDETGNYLYYSLQIEGPEPGVEIHKVDLADMHDTIVYSGDGRHPSFEIVDSETLLISVNTLVNPPSAIHQERNIILVGSETEKVLYEEVNEYGFGPWFEENSMDLKLSPTRDTFLITNNIRLETPSNPYSLKVFNLDIKAQTASQRAVITGNNILPTWITGTNFVYKKIDPINGNKVYNYNVITESSTELKAVTADAAFINYNPEQKRLLYDYGDDIVASLNRQIGLYDFITYRSTVVSNLSYNSPLWISENEFVALKRRLCEPEECPPWQHTIQSGFAIYEVLGNGGIVKTDYPDESRSMYLLGSAYGYMSIHLQSE